MYNIYDLEKMCYEKTSIDEAKSCELELDSTETEICAQIEPS